MSPLIIPPAVCKAVKARIDEDGIFPIESAAEIHRVVIGDMKPFYRITTLRGEVEVESVEDGLRQLDFQTLVVADRVFRTQFGTLYT